ncbi:MAG: hypothetical protein ACXWUN_10275, partial [Allosphingosinicella sp.]
ALDHVAGRQVIGFHRPFQKAAGDQRFGKDVVSQKERIFCSAANEGLPSTCRPVYLLDQRGFARFLDGNSLCSSIA